MSAATATTIIITLNESVLILLKENTDDIDIWITCVKSVYRHNNQNVYPFKASTYNKSTQLGIYYLLCAN